MNEPTSPHGDGAPDLTAYLDGELGEEAARAVEARISCEPAVRAEADALKRTWELLDFLPRAEATPSFTHRTLEQVSSQQARARTAANSPVRRWGRRAAWAAAAVAAGVLGFAAVTGLSPREPTDEELARDLRLLENRKAYEDAGSMEFLKALDHPDLFGDDVESGG